MVRLFTNQKEVDRAIQAAVDQYEIYRRHTLVKRTPRKRPGRHAKRPNKHSRRKAYRGQGK